ncbi:hypothetical protein Tpet_1476 [Thermotoga petrophila RKU-1]|nr:hypothetical protein Tpet_1476 [Thermotoga petrophila RKU-1]
MGIYQMKIGLVQAGGLVAVLVVAIFLEKSARGCYFAKISALSESADID